LKLDLDLIRELLIRLEKLSAPSQEIFLRSDAEEVTVEGYTPEQIEYHLIQMADAGLIVVTRFTAEGTCHFQRLSWSGHQYLESVRDPKIWRLTKTGAQKIGVGAFEAVWDLAKAYGKHVAREVLNLDL
jgi:hypothetical protein